MSIDLSKIKSQFSREGEWPRLFGEDTVKQLVLEVERLQATYVPQEHAAECIKFLEQGLYPGHAGAPVGRPNTLWAMCRDSAKELHKLRESLMRQKEASDIFEKNSEDACELWELLRRVDLESSNLKPTLRQQIREAVRSKERLSLWEDISKAPKDWSDVLLYDPEQEEEVFEGYFSCEDGGGNCWLMSKDNVRCNPTHFQPLPCPPIRK